LKSPRQPRGKALRRWHGPRSVAESGSPSIFALLSISVTRPGALTPECLRGSLVAELPGESPSGSCAVRVLDPFLAGQSPWAGWCRYYSRHAGGVDRMPQPGEHWRRARTSRAAPCLGPCRRMNRASGGPQSLSTPPLASEPSSPATALRPIRLEVEGVVADPNQDARS